MQLLRNDSQFQRPFCKDKHNIHMLFKWQYNRKTNSITLTTGAFPSWAENGFDFLGTLHAIDMLQYWIWL